MKKAKQKVNLHFKEIKAYIAELNPDALLADGFEDALIGYIERCTATPIALYDYDKCVNVLMTRDKMTRVDAIEYMKFNVVNAWVGEGTPAFAHTWLAL